MSASAARQDDRRDQQRHDRCGRELGGEVRADDEDPGAESEQHGAEQPAEDDESSHLALPERVANVNLGLRDRVRLRHRRHLLRGW